MSLSSFPLADEALTMRSDSEIRRDVLEELKWEPSVNPAHIGVSVKDGIVTLGGFVSSYAESYAAQRAAQRIDGVQAVVNEIEVRPPESSRRTDEDIANAALEALRSNFWVPADKVKVTLSNGWLKLEGDVEWQYQREAAEDAVRNLTGITGLANQIKVKPVVTPTDLTAKIEDALRRTARKDARRIKVQAQGDTVILRGRVRSRAEREQAERAAWSAPGIAEVVNQIEVVKPKPAWIRVAAYAAGVSFLLVALAWPGLLLPNWLDIQPRGNDTRPEESSQAPPELRIQAPGGDQQNPTQPHETRR